jgi:hypothetical protein
VGVMIKDNKGNVCIFPMTGEGGGGCYYCCAVINFIMIVVLQSKKNISTASYSTEAHDDRGTVGVQVL